MSNELTVDRREVFGKNSCRRLRRVGQIPAILYGEGKDTVPLQVEARTIEDMLDTELGENTIFTLNLRGTDMRRPVMIREITRSPLRGDLEHIDFIRISMDQLLEVSVPVTLVGTPDGVKNHGGILEPVMREVSIECLPAAIPEDVKVDVAKLEIGDSVRVEDLELPEGLKALDDPEQVIVHVIPPAVEKEVAVEAAEGEGEPTEPELVGKGKEEAGPESES